LDSDARSDSHRDRKVAGEQIAPIDVRKAARDGTGWRKPIHSAHSTPNRYWNYFAAIPADPQMPGSGTRLSGALKPKVVD